MRTSWGMTLVVVLGVAGCGGSAKPTSPPQLAEEQIATNFSQVVEVSPPNIDQSADSIVTESLNPADPNTSSSNVAETVKDSLPIIDPLAATSSSTLAINTNISATPATATYKFYNANGLHAVDSAAAGKAIPVVLDKVFAVREVLAATLDSVANTFVDYHSYAQVYVSEGKLFKVSALKTGTLIPQQISSESEISSSLNLPVTLCTAATVTDWVDPEKSQYVYALAGPDGRCDTRADNVTKMVALDMPSTAAPVTLGFFEPLTDIRNASGAIVGLIGIDSAHNLVKTDASFGSLEILKTSVTYARALAHTPSHIVLAITTSNAISVQQYAIDSSQLSETHLYSFAQNGNSYIGDAVNDGSNIYFVVNDRASPTSSLFRLSLAATTADAAIQIAQNAGGFMRDIHLTTNTVAYTWVAQDRVALKSVAKTSPLSSAVGAELTSVPLNTLFEVRASAGGWLYYETKTTDSIQTAYAMFEDGTKAQLHARATWLGVIFPTQGKFYTALEPTLLVLKASEGTLTSYAASSFSHVAVLGAVAPDAVRLSRFESFDEAAVFTGELSNGDTLVMLVNAALANSLLNVATVPCNCALPGPPIQTVWIGQAVFGGAAFPTLPVATGSSGVATFLTDLAATSPNFSINYASEFFSSTAPAPVF